MIKYSQDLGVCFVLFKDPVTKKVAAYRRDTISEAKELQKALEEEAKPQMRLPYADK